MSNPRIVTPEEARHAELPASDVSLIRWDDLVRTVATEPDRIEAACEARIRAAVVKALREMLDLVDRSGSDAVVTISLYDLVQGRADAIENGADW